MASIVKTPNHIRSEIASLKEQIAVQESILALEPIEHRRQAVHATIKRLSGSRYRLESQLSGISEIKRIAEDSSDDVIDENRNGQPIMCGEDVYLPIARSENVIHLPDCLLRSAVFGSTEGGEPIEDQLIGSHKNYTIRMTGYRLNAYDRRVFVACLDRYQKSASFRKGSDRGLKPLSPVNGDVWIDTTFWKLGRVLGRSFSPNVAKAIARSLQRLKEARIQVSWGTGALQVMPLLEAQFIAGMDDQTSADSVGTGGAVSFRILSSFANLYALGNSVKTSTTVDKTGLSMFRQGLTAWLACYYSSHGKFFPTNIENLHEYCGATCSLSEFRRRLKKALTELQSDQAPKQFRVSSFEVTQTQVAVHLSRWSLKR